MLVLRGLCPLVPLEDDGWPYPTFSFCSLRLDWMYRINMANVATLPKPMLHSTVVVSILPVFVVEAVNLRGCPASNKNPPKLFRIDGACRQVVVTRGNKGEKTLPTRLMTRNGLLSFGFSFRPQTDCASAKALLNFWLESRIYRSHSHNYSYQNMSNNASTL